jgi:hypothetical protein
VRKICALFENVNPLEFSPFPNMLSLVESEANTLQFVGKLKSHDNRSKGCLIRVEVTFISSEKLNPGALELETGCVDWCKASDAVEDCQWT